MGEALARSVRAQKQNGGQDQKSEPPADNTQKQSAGKGDDSEGDVDLTKFDRSKFNNRKFWAAYDKMSEASKAEVKGLKEKLAKLEAKPVTTPADSQRIQQLEAQLKSITEDHQRVVAERGEYQKKLAQIDFRRSDEFATKYLKPYERAYGEGVDFVRQLTVQDANGERQATQHDFDILRKQPLAARIKMAKDMFGDYSQEVLGFTREMDKISAASETEAKERAEGWENSQKEAQAKERKEFEDYQNQLKSALDGIRTHEEHGKWFSEDPNDPEFSKVLKEGFEEFDQFTSELPNMSMADKAAKMAMYQARSSAFMAAMHRVNTLEARNKALETELAKYREADPGKISKNGKDKAVDDTMGGVVAGPGIAGAAAMLRRR